MTTTEFPSFSERDQEIIDFADRLKAIWLKKPELRLGQLIGNAYPCGTLSSSALHKDPYYVNDARFINTIEFMYGSSV